MDSNSDPPGPKKRKLAWSSAEEMRLIELYRQFSLLWDNRLPDYYKKEQRQCALRAIASRMGDKFTVGNVRDKIKTLRDYYVKEKKREESKRKHNFRGYVPRWEHFASLEFLRHCTASSNPRDLRPNVPNLVLDRKLQEALKESAVKKQISPYVPVELAQAIKCEPLEVYPAFPDGEGPGSMILPSLADDSSDDDGEPASHAHQGTRRAAQGIPPQERPNTSLLQPGPSGTTTAIAENGPNLGLLQPEPSGRTMTPAEQRPDPESSQHQPAGMSMAQAERGPNAGVVQPWPYGMPMVHADQRPNPGLLQPGPGEMPTGHAERGQSPGLLHSGISGISRGFREQLPNPGLLHPGPYRMSTAHANHGSNTALLTPEPSDMSARSNPGLLQTGLAGMSTDREEQRPNPGPLQHRPSGLPTAHAEQRPHPGVLEHRPFSMPIDYAEHSPDPGLLQPGLSGMPRGLVEQRPKPDLLQPDASLMPTAYAGPSAGNGPTKSAQPMPPGAASPAEPYEGNGRPVVSPGPGHHSPDSGLEPELSPGAIAPCPVLLEDEGEVLFYQLLMLQLAGMSQYDQGVAKVRMQEAMFDIKHNFEPPSSPGGPAP
ncbi:hypothetical protein HPB48_020873 [Haemaphysalis longicornis]|uniref:MADF domain-containing protein n=1 Tax=Haemaphysalis longicornis TaxID=44386 RepID=A0A9J6FLZ1_HAELO|nr:hypothetical protein HPB48_020873 [Haemaphysalis longicornis]